MIEGGGMVDGVRGDFFIVALVLVVLMLLFGYEETMYSVSAVM